MPLAAGKLFRHLVCVHLAIPIVAIPYPLYRYSREAYRHPSQGREPVHVLALHYSIASME